jgi:hypothetical protein
LWILFGSERFSGDSFHEKEGNRNLRVSNMVLPWSHS